MRSKEEVFTWIARSRIVPVIRASSEREATLAVGQLLAGGIDVLEITMTVPNAIGVMREVSAQHGQNALIGAGTVYDPETAEACVEAGAQFIVGPCLDIPTIRFCNGSEVLVSAGALTPTEVATAWREGADVVKVFPCDAVGGPAYIKSLKAPFPEIPLLPTGGVTLKNVRGYLDSGALAVGVGSNLVNLNFIGQGQFEELAVLAREFRLAAGVV